MHIDLLYIAFFTAPPLGGFCPRGGGRKTKTPCRASLHSARSTGFSMQHGRRSTTAKPTFTRKTGMSYNIHAVRPDGRCVGGVSTCAGLRALARPQTAAFLFFISMISRLGFACKSFSKFARRGSRAVPLSS